MKKCAIHYKNKIIPDNINLTIDILEGIKKRVAEFYRKKVYSNLQSIAKFNLLFYEIERNIL